MKKIDHSLLILNKNFENNDCSTYAICVDLGKFCSQLALSTEKFTQSTKFLRDRRLHRSRQISSLYIVQSSTYCDVVDGMWYAVAHRSNCSYYPDTVTPCSLGNNTRCHRCNNKFEANPVVSLTGDASKWVTNTISYNIRKHFLNF